ncbi:DNA repair exonuclease SbcCD ATPase subunit [Methanofollis sp. W23]|uniref:hypothetical protein n=1 Tax=Methanofollis sp. W23 TaxID=2817849 RepID=UPI001AE3B135|nr:hypothetical protein [Methanofollis sp. W23]MBP2145405.1 DNA repair exonuclease SbcCD ATPase subunit [Methanofollis sp. W23]
MPKLRQVRIINAQFDDGKSIFEDFRMPFFGRNATYELRNGGGKSVLLMLMLQCVLPNASLDPNHPFKDMFRGGDPNRTTHILAEWELEKEIADEKYLLTGFCAKRQSDPDEEGNDDGIKYFSYLHLYNGPNDLDLEKIPLCWREKGEFVVRDYADTRKMLKEKKDHDIWIARNRREYLERLKRYCLLESEWRFIKEINRQENFLKSYFREFKTSRSLVEKLLIQTVDRCLQDRQALITGEKKDESSTKALADALCQSQNQLKELQEKQSQLHDFERLHAGVTTLQETNQELIDSFQAFEASKQTAASQYAAHQDALVHKEEEICGLKEKCTEKEAALQATDTEIERNGLIILNVEVNLLRKAEKRAEEERARRAEAVKEQEKKVDFSWAVNKYLGYRKALEEIQRNEKIIENTARDHEEIFSRVRLLGKTLYVHAAEEKQKVVERLQRKEEEAAVLKEKNKILAQNLGRVMERVQGYEQDIADRRQQVTDLEEREADLRQRHEGCPRVDAGLSVHVPGLIEATGRRIERERAACADLFAAIEERKERLHRNEGLVEGLNGQITVLEGAIARVKVDLETYTDMEQEALQIAGLYEMGEVEPCITHLDGQVVQLQESLADLKSNHASLIGNLKAAEKYGVVPGQEYLDALESLREHYPTAMSGAKYLKSSPEERRKEDLANAPWLPKAILLLHGDYKAIAKDPSLLPARVQDARVILTSFDHLREKRMLTSGDVCIPSRPPEHTFHALESDRAAAHLKKEIARVEEECTLTEERVEGLQHDRKALAKFTSRFSPGYREEREAALQEDVQARDAQVSRHATLRKKIDEDHHALPELQARLEKKNEDIDQFEKKRLLLTEILATSEKMKEVSAHLQQGILQKKTCEEAQQQTRARIDEGTLELKEKEASIRQLEGHLRAVKKECEEYEKYDRDGVEVLHGVEIFPLRAEYQAAEQVLQRVAGDLNQVQDTIAIWRKQAKDALDDIKKVEIPLAEIEAEDPHEPIPSRTIEELKERVQTLKKYLEEAAERHEAAKGEHRLKSIDMEKAETDFNSHAPTPYSRDLALLDASPYQAELNRLQDLRVHTHDEITALRAAYTEAENGQRELETQCRGYEVLNDTYHFAGRVPLQAGALVPYKSLQEELASHHTEITKRKKKLGATKEQVIDDLTGVTAVSGHIEEIKRKFRVAETIEEAIAIRQGLDDGAEMIISEIAMTTRMMDGLLAAQTKIVVQALGMAMQYLEYLKTFPAASKIEIDGRTYEMVQINFDTCAYTGEVAEGRMHQYIQDLTHHIQTEKLGPEEVERALMPDQLVGRVLDMGQIRVKIRKVDVSSHRPQQWDQVKASDGQENTMYIIFLVTLMSAIRSIVVDRYDMKTAKVLIIDNPFGSTGAHYLWEKIGSILERNNVQIICSGHNIGADVREFFPVNHILTEERSASGRTRIGIRFEGVGKELDQKERQKRGDITAWW